ncbi:MAG: hypothetical protein OXD43_07120 [Bacteroidetes bacterium]|nr:hypothetical protein [Bacteroidota bacterium]
MLLRRKKLAADEANELTEIIENMASANLIAQLGAKLDAVNATMNAQLDAVNTKYNVLIWVIGFATIILSAVIVLT